MQESYIVVKTSVRKNKKHAEYKSSHVMFEMIDDDWLPTVRVRGWSTVQATVPAGVYLQVNVKFSTCSLFIYGPHYVCACVSEYQSYRRLQGRYERLSSGKFMFLVTSALQATGGLTQKKGL